MRAWVLLALGTLALSSVRGQDGGGMLGQPSNLQPLHMSFTGQPQGQQGGPQGSSQGRGSSEGSNSGSSQGRGSSHGGGQGDPILKGFDGRAFEYYGKVGSFYNVMSEKSHQVTMKLKEGHMWNHNGTYMEGMGVQYQAHQVVVRLSGDGVSVTLDNRTLAMDPEKGELEEVLGLERGEMMVLWQLHRPDYGNTVEITTDLVQILIWETPAGTRDEGGVEQPTYLNFDIALLGPPAHGSMNGLIGETYDFLVDNVTHPDDFTFHGRFPEAEYETEDFFHHGHAQSLFGKAAAPERRIALQDEHATFIVFPVMASGNGCMKRAPEQTVAAAVVPIGAAVVPEGSVERSIHGHSGPVTGTVRLGRKFGL